MIRVKFSNGRTRIYSNWCEAFDAFDKTPFCEVQGAIIWVMKDNLPKVERFVVDMPFGATNGYSMKAF